MISRFAFSQKIVIFFRVGYNQLNSKNITLCFAQKIQCVLSQNVLAFSVIQCQHDIVEV